MDHKFIKDLNLRTFEKIEAEAGEAYLKAEKKLNCAQTVVQALEKKDNVTEEQWDLVYLEVENLYQKKWLSSKK